MTSSSLSSSKNSSSSFFARLVGLYWGVGSFGACVPFPLSFFGAAFVRVFAGDRGGSVAGVAAVAVVVVVAVVLVVGVFFTLVDEKKSLGFTSSSVCCFLDRSREREWGPTKDRQSNCHEGSRSNCLLSRPVRAHICHTLQVKVRM